MSEAIILAREWGGYAKDTVLEVLEAGEDLRPNAVDERRAEQLRKDGFLVSPVLVDGALAGPGRKKRAKG